MQLEKPNFKFEFGDIVVVDPSEKGRGPKGKVTGKVQRIDGGLEYIVSCVELARNGVARHIVSEHEIHLAET